MDLDAYTTAHRDEWSRLDRLSKKRQLDGAEADALIEGYQSVASHLSVIKAHTTESVVGDRLSLTLSRARMRFTGAPTNLMKRLPEFFLVHLPASLYRLRWWSLAVTIAFGALFAYFLLWGMLTPGVLETYAPEADRRRLAEQDFVGYYSEHSELDFSAMVWSNNSYIAALTIALGFTGIGPAAIIVQNAQGIGLTGAIMHEYGRINEFFLFIAPHGQLELYAIFVAGAGGLRLFWSWISPGARTRGQAFAEDGRSFFVVAIGLLCALGVSGLIEGFVTRQEWPWVIKIGIGTVALVGFLLYQWVLGRRAFLAGETGDLTEFEAGARRILVS